MKIVRFSLSVAALCLAVPLAASAAPPPSQVAMTMAAQLTTQHPIQVSACNAERNVSYGWSGYTPGFYPGYAGGWWGYPSVYGPMYYQPPVASQSPTLGIDYMNVTHATMKQIEFGLLVRGSVVAEVKDVGTFSPGAEIKHKFGLNPNVFPLQTSFTKCVPLKITFADGSHWKNPHLPAYRASMYGHPHPHQ